jgi:hypothetical protein
MKLTYLGDAFDHWKGSVIAHLGRILHGLRIVPMFTDLLNAGHPWTDELIAMYASLLQSPNGVVMSDRRLDRDSRVGYFSDKRLEGEFDLFLDPDRGLCRNGRDPSYVTLLVGEPVASSGQGR